MIDTRENTDTKQTSLAAGVRALQGLKVIDLSRVLGGPYCTQILADHGADVVKLEPPQGDETRSWGPPFADGLSAYFAGANRNKRCLALDLSVVAGREVLFKLLEHADVLIENFKPRTLEKWDLDYLSLQKRFPRLIHCSISGFGGVGPLGAMPGYDAAAQAWSGIMSINGSLDSGPLRMGLPLVDIAAGMNAAIGIMMALYERDRSGLGQSVQTSLFETGLSLLHPHAANWFMSKNTPGLTGSAHTNIAPYDLFKTRTCPIFLAVGNNRQFARLCQRLRCEGLGQDVRFLENKDRLGNRDVLKAELEACLANEDGEPLAEELLTLGVPAGAVLSVPQAFSHDQARALSMMVACEGLDHVAPPVRLSRTPPQVRAKAQVFGAATDDILSEAGYTKEQVEHLVTSGAVVRRMRTAPE